MFGLDYPLMSAPMALHSGGTLAGSVSAAVGLGSYVESDSGDTVFTHAYDIVSGYPWPPQGIGERVRRNRFRRVGGP